MDAPNPEFPLLWISELYGGVRHGEVRRGSRTFEPTLWVQYSLLSYIYYATHIHTYIIYVGGEGGNGVLKVPELL